MHLLKLPNELLDACFSGADSSSLRLVCKRFASLTAKHCFSHFYLRPTTESANKLRAILNNPDLAPLVTSLALEASLKDKEGGGADEFPAPRWDVDVDTTDDGEDSGGVPYERLFGERESFMLYQELSATFKRTLDQIGLFENLQEVKLLYDEKVDDPEPIDETLYEYTHPQPLVYRNKFLSKVLRALNHPLHPASQVHKLSIVNLQDVVDVAIATSRDFKAVLSRLDSLELRVATVEEEDPYRMGPYTISLAERHTFFSRDLLQYWLEPLQDQLVTLKLYSTCYWGWIPKCDLRHLWFPKLTSLAFGGMTFTHDWQIEWILLHGNTLECLVLDDSPIVNDIWIAHQLDQENYPVHTVGERLYWEPTHGPEQTRYFGYEARWHDIYRRFKSGLPHLQHFAVGFGPEPGDEFARYARCQTEAAASMYASFWSDNFFGEWDGCGKGSKYGIDRQDVEEARLEPLPSYPKCQDEDEEALEALIMAIRSRAR